MSRFDKTIGVIAGLGPLAGATFYRRLVEATEAERDEGHPSVLLISDPRIPSRLDHLSGRGPSPLPALQDVARRLWQGGAGVIALTSITTHAYYAELAAAVPIPIVDGLAATAAALTEAGVRAPALVVTTAARNTGLLHAALKTEGIDPRLPDVLSQAEIDSIVAEMKAGQDLAGLGLQLRAVLDRGWAADSDGVLIGCTDISPLVDILPADLHGRRILDVGEILARAVLRSAATR